MRVYPAVISVLLCALGVGLASGPAHGRDRVAQTCIGGPCVCDPYNVIRPCNFDCQSYCMGSRGGGSPPPPPPPRIPEHVRCSVGSSVTQSSCQPDDGYEFDHLGVPRDLNVHWVPGRHSRVWPHVYAGNRKGLWVAEDGYTWANAGRPGDYSVKRKRRVGTERAD
jgi:hypothetical protein